ncbi:MAG: hypothetical protein R3F14_29665 [Polyangiaceae bacterium]
MKKQLPSLTPAAVLAKKCSAFLGRTGVPTDHASLPVPVPGVTGLRLGVMLAPTEEDEPTGERKLQPPTHVVYGLAYTGAFAEVSAVDAKSLGIPEPAESTDESADPPEPPAPIADLDAKRARVLELLDATLPLFATARPADAAKDEARELRDLYQEIAEPPFAPYYRALGKRFFDWIDRTAAS